MTDTMRARCHPQRPWTCDLERGNLIVALDGALVLRWSSSFGDGVPGRVLRLDEGECHRVDDAGRVAIEASGRPVTALVLAPAPRPLAPRLGMLWRGGLRRLREAFSPPPSPSC
jgi:hypothetical protein